MSDTHDWYGVFLGGGVAAFQPSMQIQMQFLSAFAAAGQPDDMAIFSHHDSRSNETTLFFTPAAAAFAKMIDGAAPCQKPNSENIGLLVGSHNAWNIFFPEVLEARQRPGAQSASKPPIEPSSVGELASAVGRSVAPEELRVIALSLYAGCSLDLEFALVKVRDIGRRDHVFFFSAAAVHWLLAKYRPLQGAPYETPDQPTIEPHDWDGSRGHVLGNISAEQTGDMLDITSDNQRGVVVHLMLSPPCFSLLLHYLHACVPTLRPPS